MLKRPRDNTNYAEALKTPPKVARTAEEEARRTWAPARPGPIERPPAFIARIAKRLFMPPNLDESAATPIENLATGVAGLTMSCRPDHLHRHSDAFDPEGGGPGRSMLTA